jgi:hypothetical protein
MSQIDRDEWAVPVDARYERFQKHQVWVAVPRDTIPSEAKILSSTRAMKQKSNGTSGRDSMPVVSNKSTASITTAPVVSN